MRHINQLRYCLMQPFPWSLSLPLKRQRQRRPSGPAPRCRPSSSTRADGRTRQAYIAYDDGFFAHRAEGHDQPDQRGEYGMGALQANCAADRGNYVSFLARSRASSRHQPEQSAQVEASKPIDMRLIATPRRCSRAPGALRPAEFAVQDGAGSRQHKIKSVSTR